VAAREEHLDIIDASRIPKHIIVLAIDAFKYEYLKRYSLPNIDLLVTNGVSFANAVASNIVAETAPGFASISTGTYMKDHGICMSDCWYDKKTKRLRYFYDEVKGKLNLEVPTIGDILKSKDPSARVASISAKDRNAFLLGGPGADVVVFSYREQMHERGHFTGAGVTSDSFGWTERPGRVLPPYLVDSRLPRLMDWDGPGFHHPKENSANTPFMDEFIMEGTLKILENERPKLLFVGLVSPNIVAHAFTTQSIELRVSAEVVDRLVGVLISRLKEMGWFDDTLFIFTADHGMADKPFCIDLVGELKRKGRKDLVENIAHLCNVPAVGGLYLHDLGTGLIRDTIEALKQIEHVKGAWYKDDPDSPWFIRRGAHERAPDIIVVPEFRYQIVPEGRTEPVYPAYHGAPYFADLSIVMIFSGCGIRRMGTIGEGDIPPEEFLYDQRIRGLPEQVQIFPTIKRILRLAQ
jgi:hypothetical protein